MIDLTLEQRIANLNANIRALPYRDRLVLAFFYTLVFMPWIVLDRDWKAPAWYERTLLPIGDALLKMLCRFRLP